MYSTQQINNINYGIDKIKNNDINKDPSKEQIRLAIQWCETYDLKINKRCIYLKN